MKTFALLICLMIVPLTTFAGSTSAGDGGIGVRCLNSPYLELLDFHYARVRFSEPATLDVTEIPARLKEIFEPSMAATLSTRVEMLRARATYDMVTDQTDDYKKGDIDASMFGCTVFQLAILKNEITTSLPVDISTPKLEIDGLSYRLLYSQDRDALFLHEALHRVFTLTSNREESATALAQLVAYMGSSDEFRRVNRANALHLVRFHKPVDWLAWITVAH